MIKPDDQIAFYAIDSGAVCITLRFGDVLVSGYFDHPTAPLREQVVISFDLPTLSEREAAAKARIDEMAIRLILGGWEPISA
jgi:hypothetical protein